MAWLWYKFLAYLNKLEYILNQPALKQCHWYVNKNPCFRKKLFNSVSAKHQFLSQALLLLDQTNYFKYNLPFTRFANPKRQCDGILLQHTHQHTSPHDWLWAIGICNDFVPLFQLYLIKKTCVYILIPLANYFFNITSK